MIRYRTEIVPAMMKKFDLKNPLEVPVLEKIVVNMGVGEAVNESKRVEAAQKDMAVITGQRPVVMRARKSVSGFHLRKGMPIGCKVTLRHYRMYEFLDRLVHVALPRVRDFRGIRADAFDGQGNYNLGMAEHTVFPEVSMDTVEFPQGMDIAFVMKRGSAQMSKELLSLFGMPFAR
ncbi:MAG: 50S ribosomal protein L5 [Planctomycetota bacterium]